MRGAGGGVAAGEGAVVGRAHEAADASVVFARDGDGAAGGAAEGEGGAVAIADEGAGINGAVVVVGALHAGVLQVEVVDDGAFGVGDEAGKSGDGLHCEAGDAVAVAVQVAGEEGGGGIGVGGELVGVDSDGGPEFIGRGVRGVGGGQVDVGHEDVAGAEAEAEGRAGGGAVGGVGVGAEGGGGVEGSAIGGVGVGEDFAGLRVAQGAAYLAQVTGGINGDVSGGHGGVGTVGPGLGVAAVGQGGGGGGAGEEGEAVAVVAGGVEAAAVAVVIGVAVGVGVGDGDGEGAAVGEADEEGLQVDASVVVADAADGLAGGGECIGIFGLQGDAGGGGGVFGRGGGGGVAADGVALGVDEEGVDGGDVEARLVVDGGDADEGV